MLVQHVFVMVDCKGLGVMHALTQVVMKEELVGKSEPVWLATAVTKALEGKLGKFDDMKPATRFIGRWYGRHAMAVLGHVREWGAPKENRPASSSSAKAGMSSSNPS